MKKITAKVLLEELQKLKKQAGASPCQPDPIEYRTVNELAALVQSSMEDVFYGWGDVDSGIDEIEDDHAIIYFSGKAQIPIRSALPWWKQVAGGPVINKTLYRWVSDATGGFLSDRKGQGAMEGASDPEGFGSFWTTQSPEDPDVWQFSLLNFGEFTEKENMDYLKKNYKWVADMLRSKYYPRGGLGFVPSMTGDINIDQKIIQKHAKDFAKFMKKIGQEYNNMPEEDQDRFF